MLNRLFNGPHGDRNKHYVWWQLGLFGGLFLALTFTNQRIFLCALIGALIGAFFAQWLGALVGLGLGFFIGSSALLSLIGLGGGMFYILRHYQHRLTPGEDGQWMRTLLAILIALACLLYVATPANSNQQIETHPFHTTVNSHVR